MAQTKLNERQAASEMAQDLFRDAGLAISENPPRSE